MAARRGRPPKKAEVVEAVKETVAEVVEEVKEVKAAPKKPAVKKPKKTESISIQFLGKEIETTEIMSKVAEAFVAEGNKKSDMIDVKVYVKPEEAKAYYVINGTVTGSVALF